LNLLLGKYNLFLNIYKYFISLLAFIFLPFISPVYKDHIFKKSHWNPKQLIAETKRVLSGGLP